MSAGVHSLKTLLAATSARSHGGSPRSTGRISSIVTFILREPFFQFLFLGLLIAVAVELWNAHNDRYLIRIATADRQRIATNYYRQFGQPPTRDQLQNLLDRYVREEVYLREGKALNLDQDDEIVRRRIVQKYEFLQTDLALSDTPSQGELQRWFDGHKMQYLSPERVAFSHVYFSTDQGGEAAAKARAIKTLAALRASNVSRVAERGDAFAGPSDVSSLTPDEASRLFGESELAQALFRLNLNQWSGPYRSGYGWHLVYVTRRTASALPVVGDIQQRVLADYQDEQRRRLNTHAFETLRAKYAVRDDGGGQVIVTRSASARPAEARE